MIRKDTKYNFHEKISDSLHLVRAWLSINNTILGESILPMYFFRFLVKCLQQRSGTSGFPAYLAGPDYVCSVKSPDFSSPEILVKCFLQRCAIIFIEFLNVFLNDFHSLTKFKCSTYRLLLR